jgi:hypothetical protein
MINTRNYANENEKENEDQMQLLQANTITRFEYTQCLPHTFLPI